MGVLKLEEKWISSHCKYFGLKKKKKKEDSKTSPVNILCCHNF